MIKQDGLGSGVDLKEYFEASVGALQVDPESGRAGYRMIQRNSPLVQRIRTNGIPGKRAVEDAARALTTLWKLQRR